MGFADDEPSPAVKAAAGAADDAAALGCEATEPATDVCGVAVAMRSLAYFMYARMASLQSAVVPVCAFVAHSRKSPLSCFMACERETLLPAVHVRRKLI